MEMLNAGEVISFSPNVQVHVSEIPEFHQIIEAPLSNEVDIEETYPLKNMNAIINKAQIFAMSAHQGQEYGEHPYIVHLLETYQVAERFGLPDDIKAACFLHDILEDTMTSYAELKNQFGEKIAELVYAVTDEIGRDRNERKEKTYAKIVEHGLSAVLLKLCDRIANIENAIKNKSPLLKMYVREHGAFVDGINIFGYFSCPVWEHYLWLIAKNGNRPLV